MINFEPGFRQCGSAGNIACLLNLTNLDVSFELKSARKIGTIGMCSVLFLINAHSYFEIIKRGDRSGNKISDTPIKHYPGKCLLWK